MLTYSYTLYRVPPICLPDWQVPDAGHAGDSRAAALLEAGLEVERLDARGHCRREKREE